MNGTDLLAIPDACRELGGIGRSTLYRLFSARPPLRLTKIGGRTFISRESIDRFKAECTTPKRARKF